MTLQYYWNNQVDGNFHRILLRLTVAHEFAYTVEFFHMRQCGMRNTYFFFSKVRRPSTNLISRFLNFFCFLDFFEEPIDLKQTFPIRWKRTPAVLDIITDYSK